MERFIYAFSEEDKDYLLSKGFTLLQSDEIHRKYLFENNQKFKFSKDAENRNFVFSNMLTF